MALGDDAYLRLKDDIRAGKYAAGDRLVLAVLAHEYEMSITPVRDAIARLVAERLLMALPNRSVCIPVPSAESIIEVRRVRRELEGLSAYFACENITRAGLDSVAAMHEEFVAADFAGESRRTQRANSAFHFSIYRFANMPLLLETIEEYWIHDAPVQRLLYSKEAGLVHRANRHKQIIDALWARDADATRREIMLDIGDVTGAVTRLAAEIAGLPA